METGSGSKSALETDPIMTQRVEQIERDLQAWAAKPIEFSFNPQGTDLFSMVELARAYAKRCANFAESIRVLLAESRIVPATIIARALIETLAMGCLYLHDMERLVAEGDLKRLETRLKRFYAGRKGGSVEPIHVMDALRYLEKIDSAYVAYLDNKYGVFTQIMKVLGAVKPDLEGKSFGEMISAMKNYDELSEITHPNGTGTQYLYPHEVNETEDVERARQRFRFASLASIWQCHHLISALEKSADLPERYRAAFMHAP